jgi:charged multivesicular body protein 7
MILDEESELSGADFDILLLYLSRDKGAIAYDGKVSNSLFIGYGYELIGI